MTENKGFPCFVDLSECLETIGEREQYQGIYPEYYWSLPEQSRQDNQQSEWTLVFFFYILKVQNVGQQETKAEPPC